MPSKTCLVAVRRPVPGHMAKGWLATEGKMSGSPLQRARSSRPGDRAPRSRISSRRQTGLRAKLLRRLQVPRPIERRQPSHAVRDEKIDNNAYKHPPGNAADRPTLYRSGLPPREASWLIVGRSAPIHRPKVPDRQQCVARRFRANICKSFPFRPRLFNGKPCPASGRRAPLPLSPQERGGLVQPRI